MIRQLTILLLVMAGQVFHLTAQFTSLGDIPAFTMYGDNYFTTGTSITDAFSENNSDIKFQLGFKHRLLGRPAILGSYLFLTYQQRSFWDFYRESAPFRESNYNPGLALGWSIIRNRELYGAAFLEVEHESNGLGGMASRSWNRVSLNTKWCFTPNFRFDLSLWYPFLIDEVNNSDLLDYVGYQKIGFSWRWHPRFFLDVDTRLAWGNGTRGNVTAGMFWQHTSSEDRYLYLQVYHGYAEELVNYNEVRTFVRLGIAFRHAFFNLD